MSAPTKTPEKKSPSIEGLSSSVRSNGRKGAPKIGCDCMQCFGYCMFDSDEAFRQQTLIFEQRARIVIQTVEE